MTLALTPYEIWVTTDDGKEYVLVSFISDLGLSDEEAKTVAAQKIDDVATKLETPSPDTLIVKRGIISSPAFNIRLARKEESLES